MFTGTEICASLVELGVTHVVWLPDSTIGRWEEELEASPLQLVRVCREGEAWPLAAGLILGGMSPVVMMQTTGFFESGDAMRNVVLDLQLPVFALVGARNWLVDTSNDSAKLFALPILDAWGVAYCVIQEPDQKPLLMEACRRSRQLRQPGIVLIGEGEE